MKRIVCFMGKSGTGKSTIINELCNLNEEYSPVLSYTTRGIRNDEDKKTHVFVDKEYWENNKDKAIAVYHDEIRDYYSWTDEDSFDEDKINLYAIDPIAFMDFTEKYKSNVIGIYLFLTEAERKLRLTIRSGINEYRKEEHLSYDHLKGSKVPVLTFSNGGFDPQILAMRINEVIQKALKND